MENFSLAEETLGYVTVEDPTNTDQRYLIGPSQNVLIDQNKKVRSRPGYTRLGSGNATNGENIVNGKTWNTSKGSDLPLRMHGDLYEVYLATVDQLAINDWVKIESGFSPLAGKPRWDFWYDDAEGIDLALMIVGTPNIIEWSGAVAVVSSIGDNNSVKIIGNNVLLATFGAILGTAPFTSQLNGLLGTALQTILTFSANPTDGNTIILNINGGTQTVTFQSVLSTAGGVLIGATLANTITNLIGLLNAPGTSNGTQQAFGGGDITNIGYLTGSAVDVITKAGTSTWAQNRFYTTRDRNLKCVRTGTAYIYSGDASGLVLPVTDSSGLVVGDILVQEILTSVNTFDSARNLDTIFQFQNQMFFGSDDDEEVAISKNTDYNSFSFSAPRVAGEGGLLTLTDPVRGFGQIGDDAIIFCGPSAAFKTVYKEVAVGTTLTESLTALPIKAIGAQQGALNQEVIVQVGNALAYLSNEVALRMLDSTEIGGELQLHTLSNPIKPDFDAETWDDAAGIWYKNALHYTAPATSHTYILEYVEDANGRLRRFWQPPQILPIQCWAIINDVLHGHSNSVPETYVMFDGLSDYIAAGTIGDPDSKVPIPCDAFYAYRTYGKRGVLKAFDEYFVEGEINAATNDLDMSLNYDYGGQLQTIQKVIDGTDEEILQGILGHNSLAQASLGSEPLAGLLQAPADARKFNVTFEIARDDFMMLQPVFQTNEIDRYWSILAQGPNVMLSPRKNIPIKR